jgi:hypothetical protein
MTDTIGRSAWTDNSVEDGAGFLDPTGAVAALYQP